MKLLNRAFLLLLPMLFFIASALAIDISEFGDFSSRSIIMSGKKKILTQEQKDLLISKKLAPTTKCLMEQIKQNKNEYVELLLDFGVNPNESYMSEYPIYIAAKEDNFIALKMLFEKGAKLDRGFNSELYASVKNKNREMAQYLLDRKANVNYKDSVTENTILYLALKNKMLAIAKQLIEKGAYADNKSVIYIKKKKLHYLIKEKIN